MTDAAADRPDTSAAGPWRYAGQPALVAHRGYARHYPENTVLALAAAVCAGARFLEFDIQLTADHVPVLCHDQTLSRMAGDARNVHDLTLSEFRALRAAQAGDFGERYRDLPFSTLAETVTHLNTWPHTTSFVEIKRQSCEHFGAAAATDAVLDVLQPLTRAHVALSFVAEVVDVARRRAGQQTGWVLRAYDTAHRDRLRELRPDYVFCNGDRIPPDAALWPGPWRWVIYEVTDAGVAAHWQARGAAMIESMTVGELLRAAPFRGATAA